MHTQARTHMGREDMITLGIYIVRKSFKIYSPKWWSLANIMCTIMYILTWLICSLLSIWIFVLCSKDCMYTLCDVVHIVCIQLRMICFWLTLLTILMGSKTETRFSSSLHNLTHKHIIEGARTANNSSLCFICSGCFLRPIRCLWVLGYSSNDFILFGLVDSQLEITKQVASVIILSLL